MCSAPKERETCSLPRGASDANLDRNTLLCTGLTPEAFIYCDYSVMQIRSALLLTRKLRSLFLSLQQEVFTLEECNSCILHEFKQQPSGSADFPLLLADFSSLPPLRHFCTFSLSSAQSYCYWFFLFPSSILSFSVLLFFYSMSFL